MYTPSRSIAETKEIITSITCLQAVEMIDGEIKQPFSQLRRQKELLGSAYYDAFPYTQGLKRVPDALRPKPTGHLSAAQRRVYEVKQFSMSISLYSKICRSLCLTICISLHR